MTLIKQITILVTHNGHTYSRVHTNNWKQLLGKGESRYVSDKLLNLELEAFYQAHEGQEVK